MKTIILGILMIVSSYNSIYGQKIIDEHITAPVFLNDSSLSAIINKHFAGTLRGVSQFSVSIRINKKGKPTKVNFTIGENGNKPSQIELEKISKFILAKCKWQPAYRLYKTGLKIIIEYTEQYNIV
jgi:hypothetical protein